MHDLRSDYARQRLSLRATLALAADTPIDPLHDGAQIVLEDVGAGGTLVSWTVPGADSGMDCGFGDGWRASGGGRLLAYRNRSGLLPPGCTTDANGLELRFADRRASGGGELAVKARRTGVPTPIGPLRVTVVAGTTPHAVLRGQCGTRAFAASACRFGPGRQRLRCR